MELLVLVGAMIGFAAFTSDISSSSDSDDSPDPDDASDPSTPDPVTPLNIAGTNSPERLEGGEGDDTIAGAGGADTLQGFDGNDQISGGPNHDFVFGGAGEDTLHGDDGRDTLAGGAGDDIAFGGTNGDLLSGWSGEDTLYGGEGQDQLYGDERRVGGSSDTDGADYLDGGAGNDGLFGGGGIDTLIGGDGNDLIRDYGLSGPGSIDNPSVVEGGAGNDHIRVDGGSTITGGEGNDRFYVHVDVGEEGVTEITDFVRGEDRLAFDIVLTEDDTGPLTIQDMADGTGAEVRMGDVLLAEITGGQGLTRADLDIEFILEQNAGPIDYSGDENGERIVGNRFDNVINGGAGKDIILAGGAFSFDTSGNSHGGSDVLNGGAGDDFIEALGGRFTSFNDGSAPIPTERDLHVDTLNGGDGNDTLRATNGGILTGGDGEDLFEVNQNMRYVDNDTYIGEDLFPEPVIITDYNPDEDVIVIATVGGSGGYSATPDGEVTVETREDGTGSDVLISGWVVATVLGDGSLTVDDLSFDRNLARA